MRTFEDLPRKSEIPTMTYAGIGGRETPEGILELMTKIASELEKKGYILNSGGAKGADSAFERGVRDFKNKRIFFADDADDETKAITKEIHPAPERLGYYALKLMARNTFQIFGRNLDAPVDFVICWTKDGKEGHGSERPCGGTGQAVEMASLKGIPVINLKNENAMDRIKELTD